MTSDEGGVGRPAPPRLHVIEDRFDTRHVYEWNGQFYPSVSAVLGALGKGGLISWAAKMVATTAVAEYHEIGRMAGHEAIDWLRDAPTRHRDAAADLGHRVHEIIETGAEADEETRPYIQAYHAWEHRTPVKIIAKEVAVVATCQPGEYGGTLDLLVEHPTLGLMVLDTKTGGTVVDREGVPFLNYRLQTAAYALADVGFEGKVQATGILHITPSGARAFMTASNREEIERQGTIFQAAYVVAEEMGLLDTSIHR